MTREEAIERLNIHKSTSVFVDSIAEAIDMAIKALQADVVSREVYDKRTQADEEIIDSYRQEFQKTLSADTVCKAHEEEHLNIINRIKELQRELAEIKSNFESAVPNCQKCAIKELWKATEKEDLVEVVRCKDCNNGKYELVDNKGWIYCKHHFDYWVVDDFCSYGERRK